MLELIAFAILGLFTGALAGTLGVGGGIIMVPVLTLALGFSQQEAQATSLLVVLPTSLMAVMTLRQRGIDGVRTGLSMGIVGALASLGGAVIAVHMPAHLLGGIFGTVLVVASLRMILGSARQDPTP